MRTENTIKVWREGLLLLSVTLSDFFVFVFCFCDSLFKAGSNSCIVYLKQAPVHVSIPVYDLSLFDNDLRSFQHTSGVSEGASIVSFMVFNQSVMLVILIVVLCLNYFYLLLIFYEKFWRVGNLTAEWTTFNILYLLPLNSFSSQTNTHREWQRQRQYRNIIFRNDLQMNVLLKPLSYNWQSPCFAALAL